ncbi:MAG: myo-inositol-1-phosphate synthase [Candidatus Nitrosomirales archaeon]
MSEKITAAIIGVGNLASAFVQGVSFYNNDKLDGLWHHVVGGYRASDIKIVSALDIDANKVGMDLARSIFKGGTRKYVDVSDLGVEVKAGILEDDVPAHLRDVIKVKSDGYESVLKELKRTQPDVVVNLISSAMDKSSKRYAQCALETNASFINATPAQLAKSDLSSKFLNSKLLLVGDDLMSQFGGTAFHKGMIDFMVQRGVKVKKSYQLDVGGSMETLNTLDEKIKAMKRSIKTSTISSEAPYDFESAAGTTEYADFLSDSRVSYYWMYSEGFLNSPAVIDITLRTNDGANACNVLFDLIRAVKYCRENDKMSLSDTICAYGFKSPPKTSKIRESYADFVNAFTN